VAAGATARAKAMVANDFNVGIMGFTFWFWIRAARSRLEGLVVPSQ
jgi:hypothetical protein